MITDRKKLFEEICECLDRHVTPNNDLLFPPSVYARRNISSFIHVTDDHLERKSTNGRILKLQAKSKLGFPLTPEEKHFMHIQLGYNWKKG